MVATGAPHVKSRGLVMAVPFDEPSDVGTALAMMPGIVGFYGASSAGRLPTERVSKAQVAEFKALRLV